MCTTITLTPPGSLLHRNLLVSLWERDFWNVINLAQNNISRTLCFKSQQMAHTINYFIDFLASNIWFCYNIPFNKTNIYLNFTPHLTTNNHLFYLSSQPSTHNILIWKFLSTQGCSGIHSRNIYNSTTPMKFSKISILTSILFNSGETIYILRTYMV